MKQEFWENRENKENKLTGLFENWDQIKKDLRESAKTNRYVGVADSFLTYIENGGNHDKIKFVFNKRICFTENWRCRIELKLTDTLLNEINESIKEIRNPNKIKKGRKRTKKYPVDNLELYLEILKSQTQNKLTKKAEELLITLADNAINLFKYAKNPDDRDDCLSMMYYDLFKYWKGFDGSQYNSPFSYYTSIAIKGASKGWNKLYPEKYDGTISLNNTLSDSENGIYSI